MTPYPDRTMFQELFDFLSFRMPKSDPYWYFFWLSYQWGTRPNELRACEAWDYSQPTGIIIPLSKGQSTRTLDPTYYQPESYFNSLSQYEFFKYVNSSTANLLFAKYLGYKVYLGTGKSLGTYIFRHARIKALAASGQTPQEIAAYFGEINVNNINGYINSQLFTQ